MKLLNENRMKRTHGEYFRNLEENRTDKLQSSQWLLKSKISPQTEAWLAIMTDRNTFWINEKGCKPCNRTSIDTDHLATLCPRMAAFEYTKRHDEVVKILTYNALKKYGFEAPRRIGNFVFKKDTVIKNGKAKIYCNKLFETNLKIKERKPDLVIIDKESKIARIIEVGVTSNKTLMKVEDEKLRKYNLLAEEIKFNNNLVGTECIPVVISWDGKVTKNFMKRFKHLEMSRCFPFIQYRILKMTAEIMLQENREFYAQRNTRAIERAIEEIHISDEDYNAEK